MSTKKQRETTSKYLNYSVRLSAKDRKRLEAWKGWHGNQTLADVVKWLLDLADEREGGET